MKVQPQPLASGTAAAIFLFASLIPAAALPRWVPLPVAKSSALDSLDLPGDPARGKALYAQCRACHEIGATAGHKVGPALTGILNRPAAAYKDYPYSTALRQAGKEGLIWTRDFLDEFLEAPTRFLPGGNMAFIGIKSEQDRNSLIAYLATIKAPKDAPWLFTSLPKASIPLPEQHRSAPSTAE